MTTILLVHGAWSSAFAWRGMQMRLREAGHELVTPSLTGLGERVHLATPEADLETHVEDILQVLFHEDLTDVTLLAHSYGGMVATVVADRAPERLRQLIYLDAIVPENGKSLVDYLTPEAREEALGGAARQGEGWKVPPSPLPADMPAGRRDWHLARRHWHPLKTITSPARLGGAIDRVPRCFIYCSITRPDDRLRQFRERGIRDGWSVRDLPTGHSPHETAPDRLLEVLLELME